MKRMRPWTIVIAAAVCGAGGFAAGRMTAPSAGQGVVPPDGADTAESARARIEQLEREREELEQRLADRAEVERVPVSRPTRMTGMTASDATRSAEENEPDRDVETAPMDGPAALQALRAAIANGDADAVARLQQSVAANGEELAPDLVAMLDSADSLFAKEQIADLLGQLGDPRALPALHNLLQHESDDAVRTSVVRALGLIPDESSVSLLTAEFGRESSSPMPPSLAATSLGQIGSESAVAALRREIEQGDNGMVRAFAMRALASREDPQLVPFFLTQALRDGANDRSRKQAIEAIAATGSRRAVPELENLAFSNAMSRAVQESAKRAINQILGEMRYPVR